MELPDDLLPPCLSAYVHTKNGLCSTPSCTAAVHPCLLPGPPGTTHTKPQARASQYAPFAQRLASWGFLVVQYNAPALTIIPDAEEMPFLGSVLQWVRQHSSSAAAGSDAVPAFPVLQG
jgi:hypothetical protein